MRIVVYQDNNLLVAQCLECDICTQAPSEVDLKERLAALIPIEMQFTQYWVSPAPSKYFQMWLDKSKHKYTWEWSEEKGVITHEELL
jgi:hypothetical protein